MQTAHFLQLFPFPLFVLITSFQVQGHPFLKYMVCVTRCMFLNSTSRKLLVESVIYCNRTITLPVKYRWVDACQWLARYKWENCCITFVHFSWRCFSKRTHSRSFCITMFAGKNALNIIIRIVFWVQNEWQSSCLIPELRK